MIKVLYVDIDNAFSKKFLDNLIDHNYEVRYSNNIKEALSLNSFFEPQLIICEYLIDGQNTARSLLSKIKKNNSIVTSIILTDNPTQEILFSAIELKIDKVLLKSKSFDEIHKEIKAFKIEPITSDEPKQPMIYHLGEEFYYSTELKEIMKNEQIIPLTFQEKLLVQKLIETKGSFVEFETLQISIGKEEYTTIQTLRTVIKKVRKKTYDKIIQNKNGVGYKINLEQSIDLKSKFNIDDTIKVDSSILILKGDKQKSDILKYNLQRLGFECENVYTINDANILLEIEHYDYIIVDLSLPDGDGVDFIRDLELKNCSKVIILSTSTDIHYKEYLYFRGILDYIVDTHDLDYLSYNIYKTIITVETNTTYNHILIIERSKKVSEQLKDILLPRNYEVTLVNKIDTALDILNNAHYNLVILDLDFENCYEFLGQVKSNINSSIPFIMLSDANRNYEVVREAFKNGASECLRKPIFAEEFILKVDQLMSTSKMISSLHEQKDFMQSYQAIVDRTTIVSKTDPNGIITYVNEMFCKISKYTQEELVGKSHNIVRDPSLSKEIFKKMWQCIKKEKQVWQGIISNKAKDGSIYTVDTTIMPIIDAKGNIVEFIALRKEVSL